MASKAKKDEKVEVAGKYYVHIPGIFFPEIKKGPHAGWLEVDSLDWGMGMAVSRMGIEDDAEMSDISLSSVRVVRSDRAPSALAPLLFYNTLATRSYTEITIEHIITPYNKIAEAYKLRDGILDGYSMAFESPNGFDEEFSITFNKITFTTRKVDSYIEHLIHRKEMAAKYIEKDLTGDEGSPFHSVPYEQLCFLFSFLETDFLSSASMCCKRFLKVACDPRLLKLPEAETSYDGYRHKSTYSEKLLNPYDMK